jgi:hypothetical protein
MCGRQYKETALGERKAVPQALWGFEYRERYA